MIVAGNHLSYADWPAMALFCYEAGHYPVFTIKSPVFDVKIIGPLLRKFGQLPVYRGRADAALVLKEAEQRIGRGECVIFYPEGTASRDPDALADGGQDRGGQARAQHRGPGDPGRLLGGAGHPALRRQAAQAVPAQDGRDRRGCPG